MQCSEAKYSLRNSPNASGSAAVLAAICGLSLARSAMGETGDATNSPAGAVPDPVLNLMMEKGMITETEANKVQAEVDARRTNMAAQYPAPPSPWLVSAGIKDIELFGDLRLRYEDREAGDPGGFKNPKAGKNGSKYLPSGDINLDRVRYALRFGLRGDAQDDVYYGFRMDTSPNPRSSFTTLGTSSGSNPYYGPFGKSQTGLGVGELYVGWRPESWLDISLGRMPNPMYTSPMVWSPTLTPEGAAEKFKFSVGPVDFLANFGQMIYADSNPNSTSSGYFNLVSSDDSTGNLPWLLEYQGGVDVHLTKKIDFQVAPALYTYTDFNKGSSPSSSSQTPFSPDFSGTFVGQGSTIGLLGTSAYYNLNSSGFDGFFSNETGINDLMVLEFPFEFNVRLKRIDLRLFGDYAYNMEGGQRAMAAYKASRSTYFAGSNPTAVGILPIKSPQTNDKHAYEMGLAIASTDGLGLVYGTKAKRHGWEIRGYWQHVEQYSLDPNLIDLDFFEGVENLEGFYSAVAYSFTDNLIVTARYGRAHRINSKLGTGGSGLDIPQMNPINDYNLFQADLTFKF